MAIQVLIALHTCVICFSGDLRVLHQNKTWENRKKIWINSGGWPAARLCKTGASRCINHLSFLGHGGCRWSAGEADHRYLKTPSSAFNSHPFSTQMHSYDGHSHSIVHIKVLRERMKIECRKNRAKFLTQVTNLILTSNKSALQIRETRHSFDYISNPNPNSQ